MTDMSTPRERIENYLATCDATECEPTPDVQADIRAVLSANKSYESLMRDAAREAVAEYRKTLAAELRNRITGRAADTHPSALRAAGYDGALDDIADDLEDGTL